MATQSEEITTIAVTKLFRDRVAKLCVKNQAYEDVLLQAIELLEEKVSKPQ